MLTRSRVFTAAVLLLGAVGLARSDGIVNGGGSTTATGVITACGASNNQLLFDSSGSCAGLTTGNNGTLITSGAGVPSISSTLPSAVQGNITSLGTVTSGTFNGALTPGTTTLTGGGANRLLFDNGGTLTELATANNGTLITSGGGVPSISSTLPTAVQTNITQLGTQSAVINTSATVAISQSASVNGAMSANFVNTNTNGTTSLIIGNDGNASTFHITIAGGGTAGPPFNNGSGSATIDNQQGALFFSANSNLGLSIASGGGQIKLYNQNTSGTIVYAVCAVANANTSTGGLLALDTSATVCGLSAKAYKTAQDVITPTQAAATLDRLPAGAPVWTWNEEIAKDKGMDPHVGLYADDIDLMDSRCAVRDKQDGHLVNYEDRCVIALLVAARAHDIAELRAEIASLKAARQQQDTLRDRQKERRHIVKVAR